MIKYNYTKASLNERIQLEKLIQLIKPTNYYISSINGTSHFDAVINSNNINWLTEVKTRTTIETYCLIESYKYNNLIKIAKETDSKVLFITYDDSGYYLFNLSNLDIEQYKVKELGWKTNSDKLQAKPKSLLTRYKIPKSLAVKHIMPLNLNIDINKILEFDNQCEQKLYMNSFNKYNSPFYTTINKMYNVWVPKRKD